MPTVKYKDNPKEYRRQSYLENRKKEIKRATEWRKVNAERVRVRRLITEKVWREKHKAELAAYHRNRRKNNPQEVTAKNRKYYAKNKEKSKAWAREYRARNSEKIKERRRQCPNLKAMERRGYIRRTYGLSPENITKMLVAQNGLCEICKRELDYERIGLCVDHDHETNEIRGLLCRTCNSGIGLLGDSVSNILRAAGYLKKYTKETSR